MVSQQELFLPLPPVSSPPFEERPPPAPMTGTTGQILRDYQVAAVEAVRNELEEHRGTLVLCAVGCHAKGQPILMIDGTTKAVENVVVGDALMGPDSEPRIVTGLARGRDEMVDIVPRKGQPWRVNIDHILTLVRTPTGKASDKHTRDHRVVDVSVREWLKWNKTDKLEHKLFRVPVCFREYGNGLPVDPYFVGLYLGDGLRPLAGICSVDTEIIDYLHTVAIQYNLMLRKLDSHGTRAPSWVLSSGRRGGDGNNPLLRSLQDLGLINSFVTHQGPCPRSIPFVYKTASERDRLRLLSGLMDSDGSLCKTGNVFDFISKWRELSDDVAFVARSLGMAANVKECEKSCQTGYRGTYYRLNISGDTHRIPTRVKRKQARPRLQKKNVLRTGLTIHRSGEVDDYYGFSLTGDGRYLLGDFTVTHNTGKTSIACELIRTEPGRCLFVAHRDELIQQACNRIEEFTGEWPDIEQATMRADAHGSRHVVASVQTLSRPKRLERFDPSAFSLIIVDEVHHGTAKTYRRVTDYFDGKLIGLTATPDRADKEALGQVLDSVAYRYDITDAITDGWLCEIAMRRILVAGMDFSGIHTLAGDFNEGELEKLMTLEQNLHAVAKPTVECAGDRKTIVFTTSVAHAERLAEIIDRYVGRPVSMVITGTTPKDKRRELLREFHEGRWQFFVNVGIATEGFDEPGVACIVMGRPTKSRSLYVQMLGRGLRGGTKCRVGDKTDCLVLDFVGNSGKHEIVSTADVLSGNESEEVIERAKQVAEKSEQPKSVDEALEQAKAELAEERSEAAKKRREKVIGEVDYQIEDYNPYVVFQVRRDYLTEKYGMAPATHRQMEALMKWMGKHHKELPANLSKHEASRLMGEMVGRAKTGLSTYPQVALLAKKGYDARGWTKHQASGVISWMAKNRWQKPPQHVVGSIVRAREPGDDDE